MNYRVLSVIALLFVISRTVFRQEALNGAIQVSSRNPQAAITHYEHLLLNIPCPSDFEKRYWLGRCFSELRQYDKAILEYSTALDIYNKIPFVFFICKPLGGGYISLDTSINSDLAKLYEERGIAYMARHDYDQAIADYTHSISHMQREYNKPSLASKCVSLNSSLIRGWLSIGSSGVKRPPAQYTRYLRSLCYYAIDNVQLAEQDINQLQQEGYFKEVGSEIPATRNNWYQCIKTIAGN